MESDIFVNRSDGVFEDKMICFITIFVPSITIAITYLLYTFFGLLSFLIICGNLLVITSIIYFKQLHTPTNFLILSLAVADLLVGILLVFYGLTLTTGYSCYLQDIIIFSMTTSSLWNLCFISVDRYFAVCQPLRYRTKINVRVIMIMILLSWTLTVLSNFSNELKAYLGFYVPTALMCILYLKILIVAKKQARSIQNTTSESTKSESKMERKATKTLAIVMGVFLICWGPFFIFWVLNPATYYKIPLPLWALSSCIGFCNSMLNPFIYGFFYSWFRSAFRMIITGKIFQGDFTHSKLS